MARYRHECSCSTSPRLRILQPEVRAAVDDDRRLGQQLGVLSRISVWETEEDDVVTREDFDSGLFEYPRREWKQVRMMLTERRTGVATGASANRSPDCRRRRTGARGADAEPHHRRTTGAGDGDSDRLACVLGRTPSVMSHSMHHCASECIITYPWIAGSPRAWPLRPSGARPTARRRTFRQDSRAPVRTNLWKYRSAPLSSPERGRKWALPLRCSRVREFSDRSQVPPDVDDLVDLHNGVG